MQETTQKTRRVLCLWLPRFAAERIVARRKADTSSRAPFAAWVAVSNRQAVLAATTAAEDAGIRPGLALADARALCPVLESAPADAAADARALSRLAAWCRRFSPWTAGFGRAMELQATPGQHGNEDSTVWAGLWLEVTGCAHLMGGEAQLAATIVRRLGRAGFSARAGLAGTPGAAFALARAGRGPGPVLCPPGAERAVLALLPVAALRLDPATATGLCALGLRRIGDLYPLLDGPPLDGMARARLVRRFGPALLERLDAALGRRFEPIGPNRPRMRLATRLDLPEPTRSEAAVARACDRLVGELAHLLEADGVGLREAAFSAFRTDGRREQVRIGTVRPIAAARPLARLFALRLDRIDPGPGIDGFAIEALTTEPLRRSQGRLPAGENTGDGDAAEIAPLLAPLLDRLGGRLGTDRVGRLALRPNHLPERAQAFVRAEAAAADAPERAVIPAPRPLSRPVRLLLRPEPVEVVSEVPEGPPVRFRWRGHDHRVFRTEGPERIALDWWALPGWEADAEAPGCPPALGAAIRDYYRVEDADGLRVWVFRAGLHRPDTPARWFLHGVFP